MEVLLLLFFTRLSVNACGEQAPSASLPEKRAAILGQRTGPKYSRHNFHCCTVLHVALIISLIFQLMHILYTL